MWQAWFVLKIESCKRMSWEKLFFCAAMKMFYSQSWCKNITFAGRRLIDMCKLAHLLVCIDSCACSWLRVLYVIFIDVNKLHVLRNHSELSNLLHAGRTCEWIDGVLRYGYARTLHSELTTFITRSSLIKIIWCLRGLVRTMICV